MPSRRSSETDYPTGATPILAERGFERHLYSFREISDRPGQYDSNVVLDVIHGGNVIPPELVGAYEDTTTVPDPNKPGTMSFKELFHQGYDIERDWGAHEVAKAIARSLELQGYYYVPLARNILDFNRFPGISRQWSPHLDRLAVSGGLTDFIRQNCRKELLGYYQTIARQMEDVLHRKLQTGLEANEVRMRAAGISMPDSGLQPVRESGLIKIAVHTFDKYGDGGVERPVVGIIHRSKSIFESGHLPAGVYSRLFPHQLAAFTADRLLKASITAALEKNYIPEISDYPYMVSEGSVEMRGQALLWFEYLRDCFQRAGNMQGAELSELLEKDVGKNAYRKFWEAVLNPNQYHPDTALISRFVDGRIGAEDERGIDFDSIATIEAEVARFLAENAPNPLAATDKKRGIISQYQYDALRPSFLAIEVRKDVLRAGRWESTPLGYRYVCKDAPPKAENIELIGSAIAEGIKNYWRLQLEKKEKRAARW